MHLLASHICIYLRFCCMLQHKCFQVWTLQIPHLPCLYRLRDDWLHFEPARL